MKKSVRIANEVLKNQHTPGPWGPSKENSNDPRITNIKIRTDLGCWTNCTVYAGDALSLSEHMANVTLIQAAPDLLEALELAQSYCPISVQDVCRAALKKARGQA